MKYQDLFAGKAIFTVSNNKGKHYTFKVDAQSEDGYWFVSLLVGKDYKYLGTIFFKGGPLRLSDASKFNKDSLPYKVFVFAQKVLDGVIKLPEGYSIENSGTCFRCGRKLTTPKSIKSGYGPYCRGK